MSNEAFNTTSDKLLAWKDAELDPELSAYFEEAGGLTGFPMVRHPLVYDVPYSGMPGLLNERLNHKKDAIAKARRDGNINQYVWLHERPWRLNALVNFYLGAPAWADLAEPMAAGRIKTVWQHRESSRRIFLDVWSDSENTQANAGLWKHLLNPEHHKRRHGEFLADSLDARRAMEKMPSEFMIYRGISAEEVVEDEPGTLRSWTFDRERAEFFANRWAGRSSRVSGNSGHVISRVVTKHDLIAVILGRNESEVIVQA